MASSQRSRGRLVVALVIAALSVATYLSRRTTNELTGEAQYVKLTQDQEVALGLSSAATLTRQFGGATRDAALAGYVEGVGRRLATRSAAATTRYPFTFTVLGDRQTVNAFALPGGPVFITEALLARMQNEAQLAGVLGHELAHVVARHGAEHLARADLTAGLVGATVVAASNPDRPGDTRAKAAVAMATAQLITMKFGRDDELESDKLGVRFMHEAGYDAAQMREVMRVLKAAGGGRTPEFFSTHPDPENRLERISEALARLPSGGDVGEAAFREQVLARLGAAGPLGTPLDRGDLAGSTGSTRGKDADGAAGAGAEARRGEPGDGPSAGVDTTRRDGAGGADATGPGTSTRTGAGNTGPAGGAARGEPADNAVAAGGATPRGDGTATQPPAPLPRRIPGTELPALKVAQLPEEAVETLKRIAGAGPFPFDGDGAEYVNRDGQLPYRPGGYYKTFTVPLPGDRGRAARLVTGANGERYYQPGKDQPFSLVVP